MSVRAWIPITITFIGTPIQADDHWPWYSDVFISASNSALIHTSSPWVGERSLFLWYAGHGDVFYGLDRVEFSFEGTLEVLDVVPLNGMLNVGTVQSPALIFPTCADQYMWMAEVRVIDSSGAGGTLCLTNSGETDLNCSRVCNDTFPDVWWLPNAYRGFASDGSAPCEGTGSLCPSLPVSVDRIDWGSVKATYR